jgi:glycosyltransferase involved in cell wall biosynthesis
MRLVFVTQHVDPAHPALGATVAKIRALAEQCERVAVLADGAVPGTLPDNCSVALFRSSSKAGRGVRFQAALARELARTPRPAAVVAHMCPIYAVLAAPLARPVGVRVLLWFTHWRASRLLRVAERASNAVLTVDEASFPLPSRKLRAIGHGIDVAAFSCSERGSHRELGVLTLGRTSPAKGLETVVRAVALTPGATLRQLGPSLTDEERRHRAALERLARDLGVEQRVTIGDAIPRELVPAALAGADVLVNNMRAGATDKVVFEAAATCLPVLASNPALVELLPPELRFERDDPSSLAARLVALADVDRTALGRRLRSVVEREHSVDGWAERVLEAAT